MLASVFSAEMICCSDPTRMEVLNVLFVDATQMRLELVIKILIKFKNKIVFRDTQKIAKILRRSDIEI
jgi:predicted Zn-ribbon and HTH transcriptional regulator